MKESTTEHLKFKAPGVEVESINPGFYTVVIMGLILVFFMMVVYRKRKA